MADEKKTVETEGVTSKPTAEAAATEVKPTATQPSLEQIVAKQKEGIVDTLFGALTKANPWIAFGLAYFADDVGKVGKALEGLSEKYPTVSYLIAYSLL